MRVTAEIKAETRQRILEAARQLFAASSYEATTTRDIADAADIANGTLFNYFASKEAILTSLVAEAITKVHSDFDNRTLDDGSFEEGLFTFVAAGLRKLKPWRKQLPALVETALNPLAAKPLDDGQSLRLSQLEGIARLAKRHGYGELSAVAFQLYWTLYTGLLMFWAQDRSPKQEDTLALLDESLSMFTGWLQRSSPSEKERRA